MLNRRTLITGLISLVAAPAIVRASSLMPVKTIIIPPSHLTYDEWARRSFNAEDAARFYARLKLYMDEVVPDWATNSD